MSAFSPSSPHDSKILILEPYYGGSHKVFIEDLIRHLPYSFDLLTLPARKWKWRMRLAAPYFAEKLQAAAAGPRPDYQCVLCSTFVDVAAFRALAPTWIRDTPILTYFHENQFDYPVQNHDERDVHFAITNYTTALASDRVAFNSQYNRDSFLAGCRELFQQAPDMKHIDHESAIMAKSTILYPALDFGRIDKASCSKENADAPVIVWNHRWEHDKNPETFFKALFELDSSNVPFKLIVLGQSFRRRPAVFEEARERLGKRVLHFGYVKSRREYIRLLQCGDVVVSSAHHEFYGMSVIEAVRAGCRPVLPKRLSYPELFPQEFLYDDGNLTDVLRNSLAQGRLEHQRAVDLTQRYSWEALIPKYQCWLNGGDK